MSLAGIPAGPVVERAVEALDNGSVPASAVYLPSLALLEQPPTNPSAWVESSYGTSPAPMGLVDYGLSAAGASSFTTPNVMGSMNLSGYNASSGSLYEATGSEFWDGLSPNSVATPWQSSIQLNSVVTNVSNPGTLTGVYWAQNVLDVSGGSLQLVDNVWNLSSQGAAMEPHTLHSGEGTLVPGSLYYCEGPRFPLAFPLSIQLTNAAYLSGGRTTVAFGYHIVAGTSIYTGIYDQVVFESILGEARTPGFTINGSSATPFGLLYDAELVVGGPGDGSNAMIAAMNGTAGLYFGGTPNWTAAPSTYDYGADTGETSVGIAASWSGSNETLTQGPSLLYGLWNTSGGAPSGHAVLSTQLDPSYAFLFVGPDGLPDADLAYAPSFPNGTVEAVLPPYLPPASEYNLTALADGFKRLDLTVSLTGSPAIPDPLGLVASAGVWNAPIYLDGDAQAAALAFNATGSGSPPYTFSDLVVDVNLTFDHMNDYQFPEFDLFWANGVSEPIIVRNISQGPDTPTGLTNYLSDSRAGGYTNDPNLGSLIAVWGGGNDSFSDLTLTPAHAANGLPLGGAVALWNVSDASASSIQVQYFTYGVWVSDSPGFDATEGRASHGGAVISLMDSPHASASNLTATDSSIDIFDQGGTDGVFANLSAGDGGYGMLGDPANGTVVAGFRGVEAFEGLEFDGSSGVTTNGVSMSGGGDGLLAFGVDGLRLNATSASDQGGGAFVQYSEDAEITNTTVTDAFGVILDGTNATSITSTTAIGPSIGVLVAGGHGNTVEGVNASASALQYPWPGVGIFPLGAVDTYQTNTTSVTNVTALRFPLGLWDSGSRSLLVNDLNASSGSYCAELNGSEDGQFAGLACSNDTDGLLLQGGAGGNRISASTFADIASYGVAVYSSTSNRVFNCTFSGDNGATGVYNGNHIQAFSAGGNYFDSSSGVGNRWADWHTYSGPHLAPYVISNGVVDYAPIGPIAYPITFAETGLPTTVAADTWLVSLGGSTATRPASNSTITLWEPNGSQPYLIKGPKGYVLGPMAPTGSFTVDGSAETVPLGFDRGTTYTFTVTQTGAIPHTPWCVQVVYTLCTATGKLSFLNLTPSVYPYDILGAAGYSWQVTAQGAPVGGSGTVSVVSGNAVLHAKFSPLLYAVTFEKSGWGTVESFVASVNVKCTTPKRFDGNCYGMAASGRTPSAPSTNVTVMLRNGTYTWKVRPVRGYLLDVNGIASWSGTVTVQGAGAVVYLDFALGLTGVSGTP